MPRRQLNGSKAVEEPKKKKVSASAKLEGNGARGPVSSHFARFAHETARIAGRPATFLTAVFLVIVWAASGPLFGYSDTWQLVINTSTTIITFLMVFVIQNSQNRDSLAIQIKLSELITSIHGPKNARAIAENLSEEELEQLHKEYERRAASTRQSLEQRRAAKQ